MLLVGEDGARVELRVVGYEIPEADPAEDEWDANWLLVSGSVRLVAGAGWSFCEPALTTWEAADLVSWMRRAAQGEVPVATGIEVTTAAPPAEDADQPYWWDRLQDAGWLTFTEPDLAFAVGGYDGPRVVLLVGFGAESAPPPFGAEEEDWCSIPLPMAASQLEQAAAALEGELDPHPAR